MTTLTSILTFLLSLFAPPPLETMTQAQKIGRVLFVSTSLMICSILLAMLAAIAIFVFEWVRHLLKRTPETIGGLEIVLLGIAVNAASVFVLLQIRKADRKLMSGQHER